MATRRIICPGCGAPVEANDRKKFCEYCGSSLIVDDGMEHIQINNAEDMGYQFEKGRQRARAEQRQKTQQCEQNEEYQQSAYYSESKSNKKNTALWVLGWVLCFPIPLTILILRNKKMKSWLKAILLVLLWGLILFPGGRNNSTKSPKSQATLELPTNTNNVEVEMATECVHDDEASATSNQALQDMVIVDYGYAVVRGYLYVGFELYNPNENYYIQFPAVRITARDNAGVLLGTEDMTLSEIYPNSTVAYGFLAFEVEAMPDSVEIVPVTPDEYNVKDSTLVPTFVPLEVVGCAERNGSIVGEVKNSNDYDLDMVAVTIMFRDENGKILYADSTFVDKVQAGAVVPFSEYIHYDGTYNSFTVTAIPW